MALHPQVQALLDMMSQAEMPAPETLDPATMRAAFNMPMAGDVEAVASVNNRRIPGAAGEMAVRIYTPEGQGPHRLLVFFHGGGFVIGSLDTHDAQCRVLANAAEAVVVSVDYRLAPEHPFPAAPEDAYTALCWAAEHAAELSARPETLAVGGDSAGGALAAAVCQMSQDRGGPAIAYQLLFYPVTDNNFETSSYLENAEGYFLTRTWMQWFWDHYLAAPGDVEKDYCAPLRRKDFSGLPPASVMTAQYDPLKDEGESYARALEAAGVPVQYRCWEGMVHGFTGFLQGVDAAREGLLSMAAEYRAAVA